MNTLISIDIPDPLAQRLDNYIKRASKEQNSRLLSGKLPTQNATYRNISRDEVIAEAIENWLDEKEKESASS